MGLELNGVFHKYFAQFKHMYGLIIAFVLFNFGWGLVAPIFNIRINEVTGSLFLSGIIFSTWGLVRLLTNIKVGALCDKWGPKKLLQISFASYSIITLLYAFVNSFTQLIVLRIVHSVMGSFLWISSWVITYNLSKGDHAGQKISYRFLLPSLASLIAPLIGGLIITLVNWVLAYYLLSLCMFLSFIYITLKLKPVPFKDEIKSFKKEFTSFFKKRFAVRLTVITIIFYTVISLFTSFLPIYLSSINFDYESISVIMALNPVPYLVLAAPLGLFADKKGKKHLLMIGFLLLGSGLFLTAYVTLLAEAVLFIFLINSGSAFISLSINIKITELLSISDLGSFTSIFESIKESGAFIGPLIGGLLSSIIGFSQTFLACSMISLIAVLIIVKK